LKITAAFATDEGKSFMDRHFGDARYFDVYEIDENGSSFLKRIDNSTDKDESDDVHGDPAKAGGIMGLLLKENVNVAVSKNFGPNMKRILKKFACVRFSGNDIGECIKHIQKNIDIISVELGNGGERRHISLTAGS
jgi:predicted Fe-Mo cluster-binding NifX family protein